MNQFENSPCFRDASGAAILFHNGENYAAYEYLGAHGGINDSGRYTYTFRVWAPHAVSVTLNADFTDWTDGLPMTLHEQYGIWEAALETDESLDGKFYKFAITGQDGVSHLKADPYAFYSETLTKTASIVQDTQAFSWTDAEWMKKRAATVCPKQRGFKPKVEHFYSAPLNVYEVHLGSWHKPETGEEERYLNYREIADRLAPYLTGMGYTHVELLPVMEHPYDGSLGYQITGYFAPTARYGKPDDFRYFVNKMHEAGIGVILDWMPSHFPNDAHGLCSFDGQPLYEYSDSNRMENRVWDMRCFDLSRAEVQSFLISSAMFWIRAFHADGLRIGAVASMLWLDYDKQPSEWSPNADGSRLNSDAVHFLKKLNATVSSDCPDVLMIAEDSSDYPLLTRSVQDGGLGFHFKWNTAWEKGMYTYVSTDPIERKHQHDTLTKTPTDSFRSRSILPFSHDGVMNGKKSLLDKCFGEYDDKFACMRALLLYKMTMPGKKLLFMGTEFAQFREWDYTQELEWFMTEYPRHIEMQRFVKALNHFYLDNRELWEIDDTEDGFAWINRDLSELNVLSYRRRDKKGHEIIVALNFAPVVRTDFTIYVPKMGRYEEIFTTDRYEYGGKNRLNEEAVRTQIVFDEEGAKRSAIDITLPALGGVIYRKQQNK